MAYSVTYFYRGHAISVKCQMYWALGTCYKTQMAAKKAIDKVEDNNA